MMNGIRLNRHDRWHKMASAYVDGALGPRDTARFQAHLSACDACRERTAEFRGLKLATTSLTPPRAPRSFRLTEAMVEGHASPAPRAASRPLVVARWGMRATATLALFAIALIGVSSLSTDGGDDDDGLAQVASEDAATDQVAPSNSAPMSPRAATAAPEAQKSAGVPTFAAGGADGAGAPSTPTAQPSPEAYSTSGTPLSASAEDSAQRKSTLTGVAPPQTEAPQARGDASRDWRLPTALGLGVLAAIAAAGAWGLGRRGH